jgi:hypothetical protein
MKTVLVVAGLILFRLFLLILQMTQRGPLPKGWRAWLVGEPLR